MELRIARGNSSHVMMAPLLFRHASRRSFPPCDGSGDVRLFVRTLTFYSSPLSLHLAAAFSPVFSSQNLITHEASRCESCPTSPMLLCPLFFYHTEMHCKESGLLVRYQACWLFSPPFKNSIHTSACANAVCPWRNIPQPITQNSDVKWKQRAYRTVYIHAAAEWLPAYMQAHEPQTWIWSMINTLMLTKRVSLGVCFRYRHSCHAVCNRIYCSL